MKRVIAYFTGGLLLLLVALTLTSFTPPIFSANSVAELRRISVDGDTQYLLMRGHDRDLPVLLFLHGGPGMPAMYLAHDFQRELEKSFVIVHWDQRGAGKSFRTSTDPESMKISRLLRDSDIVVDYLLDEFETDKLWLLGHSHGSYLGALYARRHPEKLSAFVGVGQIGDPVRAIKVQDTFLRRELESLGLPPDLPITAANREDLLFQTGSELYGETSFLPLVMSGVKALEYNVIDVLNVKKGSSFSSRHMEYDVGRSLIANETDFEVPIAFIMGASDMTTPVVLAREYYEVANAPDKRFFVVQEASHFPHFEKPDRFESIMLELKAAWH
jgi:pimeloyl-ACP methyl ester carboxylesterase